MTAKQMLELGRLDDAIQQLGTELRNQPENISLRTALFEVLCFGGYWDRARKQLDALDTQGDDTGLMLGTQVYRTLIDAEQQRTCLFETGVRPRFVLSPPDSVNHCLQGIEWIRHGRFDEAKQSFEQAELSRGPVQAQINQKSFDDLRDVDDRFAPVLEVFAPTGYCWIPWEHIQLLEVPPPIHLRDLLWAPARIATFDGQLGEVHLPLLYPGSASSPEAEIRLGRKTEWLPPPGIVESDLLLGHGRRLLLAGDEVMSLLDFESVQIQAPPVQKD